MSEVGSSLGFLQASYLMCANNLRREAKLCDIILYVQGRMGAMVGYPAHKLLLISASKYFKLLFEREDLRNYCHFPHLSEEGVFAVLDIIYGREMRKETKLDDALVAARFLQVDCAVEVLEKKREEIENRKETASLTEPLSTLQHHRPQHHRPRKRSRSPDDVDTQPASSSLPHSSSPSKNNAHTHITDNQHNVYHVTSYDNDSHSNPYSDFTPTPDITMTIKKEETTQQDIAMMIKQEKTDVDLTNEDSNEDQRIALEVIQGQGVELQGYNEMSQNEQFYEDHSNPGFDMNQSTTEDVKPFSVAAGTGPETRQNGGYTILASSLETLDM